MGASETMKQRHNAPWAYGVYRALQKLSSERGPAPKYVPPPEPIMVIEDVIEEVHHVVGSTGKTDVVCVMVHPEDYCDLLKGMHTTRYQMPLAPNGPSSLFQRVEIMTGVGQVEIRRDQHITRGSVIVVTK